MKLAAIVGTNADLSYNRFLLYWMRKHFADQADIQVLEIGHLPPFSEDVKVADQPAVLDIASIIDGCDGVIISCPEYDHSVPAVLKSFFEWLSYELKTLRNKPVLIVGGSYGPIGSARAQLHLRQILSSPEIQANVVPGKELLVGNVHTVIDDKCEITSQAVIDLMDECFADFKEYLRIMQRGWSSIDDRRLPPRS